MRKNGLIFLVSLICSCFCIGQGFDTIKVKVHDHIVTLYSSGIGKPNVILEAGGGSNHKTWQLVQPKLANSSRVVSYDRPGYLNSDTCTSPRDAITIAKELKEALTKANIQPPYIFAGWSYGGSLARVFAGLYPKDVVGMVLVDPAPEDVYARFEKEFPEVMKEDEKYMNEILTGRSRPGEREEMRMYDSAMNQARRSDKLHSTPTTLLIAAGKAEGGQDRDTSQPMARIWVEELVKWAKKRPNLRYEIIANSGHHMARFQPDTVVKAILHHVDQYHIRARKKAGIPDKKPEQLKDGIQTRTLKEAGLNEKKLKAMVDSLINTEMKKQKIPGLSIAVVRDGKMDYVKGYGYANLEHKVPVKPETIFQSGSVGKQFTAFAIMLLVEDGKIGLDDPLNKFFPDAPATWEKVTVKNLLTHTGGFGDYPNDFDYRASYTEDSMYRLIRKIPIAFNAGERSQYSNLGYVTLGIIIGKITGKFYGDFLGQRIFEPLGMSTARVISERDIIPNRAAGYRIINEEIKNQQWVSPTVNTTADGALYLTALDMAKWEAGLNAGKLLKKESYEAIWSPVKLNDGSAYPYGFGWAIDSINGKRILEHNGTWQGFETVIKRYPEKKLAVVVFANLRGAKPNKIATRIMELYQAELARPKLKAINDTEPAMTAIAKEFVIKSMEQKLTADLFTPAFGKQMIDMSPQIAAGLKPNGSFIKLELLDRKTKDDGMRVYHYRVIFSREEMELVITLTKENKIAGVEGRE